MCMCDPSNRGIVCNDCRPQWEQQCKDNLEKKINNLFNDSLKRIAWALYEFKNSKKESEEYLKMICIIHSAMTAGKLSYSRLEDVARVIIDGKEPKVLEVVEREIPTKFLKTSYGEIKLGEILEAIENLECGSTEFYNNTLRDYLLGSKLIVCNGGNSYIPNEGFEGFAEDIRKIYYDWVGKE